MFSLKNLFNTFFFLPYLNWAQHRAEGYTINLSSENALKKKKSYFCDVWRHSMLIFPSLILHLQFFSLISKNHFLTTFWVFSSFLKKTKENNFETYFSWKAIISINNYVFNIEAINLDFDMGSRDSDVCERDAEKYILVWQ